MKIAIDIDSTLHHYWDAARGGGQAALRRRACPTSTRSPGTIDRLRPEQLKACIAETHAERHRPGGRAVPRRRRGRRAAGTRPGHWIHITSHRATEAHERDRRAGWSGIGLPYDELHCSYDKITRCPRARHRRARRRQPGQPPAARSRPGSSARRSLHPWNRELVEEEDVIAADDWPAPRAQTGTVPAHEPRPRPRAAPRPAARARARAARHRLGPLRARRGRCSTGRSTTSSTTCGSAARSRGSRTCRPRAAPCSSPTTPAPLPPDAAMIAKAIKEEHPRPRPLHLTMEHFFKGYPGLQHAAAEARRRRRPTRPTCTGCSCDEEQLVLVFPEGAQGHREALQGPLPPAPLRPRRLRQGGDAGRRADRPDRRRRRRGGPAGLRADHRCWPARHRPDLRAGQRRCSTCPRSSRSASSSRSRPTTWATSRGRTAALVQTISQDIRARIQEELFDMVGKRDSVWFG